MNTNPAASVTLAHLDGEFPGHWKAIRQALEHGFQVSIDEQRRTAVDRGYVARTGDVSFGTTRVDTHYEWVAL